MPSLSTQFELPGSKPHYNPDILCLTKNIFLDLVLDFPNKTLFGESNLHLEVVAKELNHLKIDACEMDIISVYSASLNQEVEYTYDGKKIHLNLPKTLFAEEILDLKIKYLTKNPKFGINFVTPNKYYPDKPYQVWTQGESQGSRFWYPCLDFPRQITPVQLQVRVPKEFTAISNGEKTLEGGINQDGLFDDYLSRTENKGEGNIYVSSENYKTVKWEQMDPIPNYLVVLTVGQFHEIQDGLNDLPINYYTSNIHPIENLQLTGQKTPRMIEFFENKFGVKYPWKKYDQVWVNDFIWGGMEDASCTINTHRALADKKSLSDFNFPEILVAHELSHQWFGDLIVITHWKDLWVKEGAATYSEALWWEYEYGKKEFDYYRFNEWDEYISESYKRPTVTNIYRHVEDLYDRHSYTKAGTLYHIIRSQIGDENFTKFTKNFLENNRHKNVEAIDLVRAIEAASGINILPILDQFLYTAGHPDFEVSFSWDEEAKTAKLDVNQKQAKKKSEHEKLFKLDIPVEFGYVNEDTKEIEKKSIKIKISEPEQTFYIPLDKKPDYINFEAGNNFVKGIELKYDLELLKNQLFYSDEVIAQILAAKEIAKKDNLKALEILKEAYQKEDFWGVRLEIIAASKKIKLEETFDFIKLALKDESSRVRSVAINSLSEFKNAQSFDLAFEIAKNGDENSYQTQATALKTAAIIANSMKNQELVNKVFNLSLDFIKFSQSWNDVLKSAGVRALVELKDKAEILDILLENTVLGTSDQLRVNTMMSLGSYAKYQDLEVQERVLDKLEELSSESHIFSERGVLASCSQIVHPKSIAIARKISTKSLYGRMQRKAMEISDSLSSKLSEKDSQSEIQKQLDELEKENKKLRSRVEKLEVK
jgi:aminopeptidase N